MISVVGCGYLLAAIVLIGRSTRDRAGGAATASAPDVTVLKPLHGGEPGLFENLASFCDQDYSGRIQIIFGVQNPHDDAVAVVERLRKARAASDLDLVVDTKVHGLNRKVSNLVNTAPAIRHEVVILSDSDMRVDPGYLRRVVAALERPGVGAVTCLYYGMPLTGMWARLSALAINSLARGMLGFSTDCRMSSGAPCRFSASRMIRTTSFVVLRLDGCGEKMTASRHLIA